MAYDIGPKIGIDGEKEFRDSINKIITEMKTLGTEMDVVTTTFQENANSQEALTQKNEVLNKQIDAQKRKLELLQKGLEESAKKYGEADTKTLKWQQTVNRAQADLNRLEAQLADNVNQLNNMDAELAGASDSLEELAESAQTAQESFSVMKGALADLAADGIQAVVSGAKEMAQSYTDAMTQLQGQTGATEQEMSKYKDSMEQIYQGGYGESITEVAEAISLVSQQMKDLDPSEMEKVTSYAMDLEQTFGFDVAESVKTVNQLMKQFHISAEEAFDIIVSGAQEGLNQNDNLLDVLNEYSPKYASIGLSAKEMYNSLRAGTEEGVFDIDKLGDAMNEFTIRVLDGSDTTKDAFKRLGLNAEVMSNQFAQGGDVAKNAFKQTLQAIKKVEDPLEKSTIGVELFGSMWEDTGGSAILAMEDIEQGVDHTKGAIKKLDKVNSDNLNNKFKVLGRTIETEVVYPVLEDAYPAIEKIVDYTTENIDDLIPLAKAAAAAMAAIFTVNKASQFLSSIKNISSVVSGLSFINGTNSIIGFTSALGGIAIPAAAATAGIVKLKQEADDAVDNWNNLVEELNNIPEESIQGLEEGFNSWSDAMSNAEGYLSSFNTELFASAEEQQNLTENMKEVQDGITEICQLATEERRGYTEQEIGQLDEYFQKLNELQEQQYQVEVEKMQAIAQASAGYAENQNVSFEKYQETAANWIKTAEQQKENMLALIDEQTIQETALLNQRYGDQATMSNQAYANEYNALIENAEKKKEAVDQNMAELYTSYANGYWKISDENSIFNQKSTELYASLEEAMSIHNQAVEYLGTKYGENTKIYQSEVENLTQNHDQVMQEIWGNLIRNMDSAEASQLASWLSMVADAQMNGAQLDTNTRDLVSSLIATLGELPEKSKNTIKDTVSPMLKGLKESEPSLYAAAQSDGKTVIGGLEKALEIGSPSKATRRIFQYVGEGAVLGLKDKKQDVKNSASSLAISSITAINNQNLYQNARMEGRNIPRGLADGIYEEQSAAINAAITMAASSLEAAKRELDINSPSGEFEKIGDYSVLGFVKGFNQTLGFNTGKMLQTMKESMEIPDLSKYRTDRVVYNVTHVYLGNKELTRELTGGIVKEISYQQGNRMSAKGRRMGRV